jgi:hypothetical protein
VLLLRHHHAHGPPAEEGFHLRPPARLVMITAVRLCHEIIPGWILDGVGYADLVVVVSDRAQVTRSVMLPVQSDALLAHNPLPKCSILRCGPSGEPLQH